MDDRLIAEDLLNGVRQAATHYNKAALDASDEDLKKAFLDFHQSEMSTHTEIYSFMKNRGWYPQEAGDMTVAGGFMGGYYPHGRGQQIPVDEPDRAYGLSRYEVENEPRTGGHSYRQQEEGRRHFGEPLGRMHAGDQTHTQSSHSPQQRIHRDERIWQNTPQQVQSRAGDVRNYTPDEATRFYRPTR